ncbi:MAG: Phosphoglucomutase [Eubacteriales bacterium SKADARSKE-1]|nr:Phosphoglucomutase [Eubacteriales bacterium SKADARSKE-1]
MNEKNLYELWLKNANDDADLIEELKSIKNNDAEICDRFYMDLKFGTAGLRGIIGAGTNRINIYTIRKATQGLANYLNSKHKNASVCISFDSRIKSDLFAKEAAQVLAANKIKVHIVRELNPVPFLSFATRELKCNAGIMITASHNPSIYNGYKCYGPDGCQMTDKASNDVFNFIEKLNPFTDIKTCDFEAALADKIINYIDDSITIKYLEKVKEQSVNPGICEGSDLKVVYTPLNGSGNKLVKKILNDTGIENISVVKEQENPDGNFPTCTYPNPEDPKALTLAIDLAKQKNADLVIATDPDSDRIGIAVLNNNEYRLMTGNEVGVLLLYYILSQRSKKHNLPQNPVIVKTIVSTDLADKIAKKYNCEVRNVLTGFKYIGEQILELEKNNEEHRFIFGFEESYGYLAGSYVRDKDGVVAAMLVCEMAAYYKNQKKSLANVMTELYNDFGHHKSSILNYGFKGAEGMTKMEKIMDSLRQNPPEKICNYNVEKIADYFLSKKTNIKTGKSFDITLPKSNVISYFLKNGNKVIVRPSGTEPKIKVYITSVGKDLDESQKISEKIIEQIPSVLKINN